MSTDITLTPEQVDLARAMYESVRNPGQVEVFVDAWRSIPVHLDIMAEHGTSEVSERDHEALAAMMTLAREKYRAKIRRARLSDEPKAKEMVKSMNALARRVGSPSPASSPGQPE